MKRLSLEIVLLALCALLALFVDVHGQEVTNPPSVQFVAKDPPYAQLIWNRHSDPTVAGYYLYVQPADFNIVRRFKVDGRTNISLVVKDLDLGKQYKAAISAYNTEGFEGPLSAYVFFTASPTPVHMSNSLSISATYGELQKSNDLLEWQTVASPYLTKKTVEPKVFFRVQY